MLKVLKELQKKQIITITNDGEIIINTQAIVGDQLTVERAINALLEVANGFDEIQRLEGMHLEVADFHASLKLLQVKPILF